MGRPLNEPLEAEAPPEPSIGPEQSFAPRPYPRREAGSSPLRGCRARVIDDNVQRGRRTAVQLSSRAAASRHHSGGEGLSDLLDGRDQYDIIVVPANQVDDDDIAALQGLQGQPSVVLIGEAHRAEAHGLQAIPAAPTEGDLAIGVARALEARSLATENESLRALLEGRYSFGNIVTRDANLRSVLSVMELSLIHI